MPNYNGYDGQLGRTIILCHQYFIDDLIDRSKSFFIIKLNTRLYKYIHAAIYKVIYYCFQGFPGEIFKKPFFPEFPGFPGTVATLYTVLSEKITKACFPIVMILNQK